LTPELPLATETPAPTATVVGAADAAALPPSATENDASVDHEWEKVDSVLPLSSTDAVPPAVADEESPRRGGVKKGTMPGLGRVTAKSKAGVDLADAIFGADDGTPNPAALSAYESGESEADSDAETKPDAPRKEPRKVDESPIAPAVASAPKAAASSASAAPLGSAARVIGAFAIAAAASFALVRFVLGPTFGSEPRGGVPAAQSVAAPELSAPAASGSTPASPAATPKVDQLALPPGIGPVPPDKGLLEIFTGDESSIYEDGVFIGRGPLRRDTVSPGEHEVMVRKENQERHIRIEVHAGARTRVSYSESAEAP
jgi:hypothetical protein